MLRHIVSIAKCIKWYVNMQVKFRQDKYVMWYTCSANDLEKKTIWIPAHNSQTFKISTWL